MPGVKQLILQCVMHEAVCPHLEVSHSHLPAACPTHQFKDDGAAAQVWSQCKGCTNLSCQPRNSQPSVSPQSPRRPRDDQSKHERQDLPCFSDLECSSPPKPPRNSPLLMRRSRAASLNAWVLAFLKRRNNALAPPLSCDTLTSLSPELSWACMPRYCIIVIRLLVLPPLSGDLTTCAFASSDAASGRKEIS
mmetsp:Transcript_41730/g.82566  ORF Transcript_41730/g.82566 Transcript_41730/m.82566 type:complete len:192 (+) Transcript_41730:47-622(+)